MPIDIDLSSVEPIVQGALESNYSHNITQAEINALGLTYEHVMECITAQMGKRTDAYWFADPTSGAPDKYMFGTYGWTPLKVGIRFKSAEIISVTPKTEVVIDNLCTNDLDYPVQVETRLSKTVRNSCSYEVSNSNSVSVSAQIGVNIKAFTASLSSSYTHTWGKSETTTSEAEIGIQSAAIIPLPAKSSAHAILEAEQQIVKVKVVYGAYLCGGGIVIRYNDRWQGHRIYYLYHHMLNARSVDITDTMTITNFNKWNTCTRNTTNKLYNSMPTNFTRDAAKQPDSIPLGSSDVMIGFEKD